jgi:hypothetical protein
MKVSRRFGGTCLSVCLSIYLWAYSPVGPWQLFQFDLFTQLIGLLWRGIGPSQGRYLHTGQHKHRINLQRPSMHQVGFEPMIPVFERAKTFHALDCAATVISCYNITILIWVLPDIIAIVLLSILYSTENEYIWYTLSHLSIFLNDF